MSPESTSIYNETLESLFYDSPTTDGNTRSSSLFFPLFVFKGITHLYVPICPYDNRPPLYHGELGFLLLVSHSVPFVFANSASVISENGELFLQSMLHGTRVFTLTCRPSIPMASVHQYVCFWVYMPIWLTLGRAVWHQRGPAAVSKMKVTVIFSNTSSTFRAAGPVISFADHRSHQVILCLCFCECYMLGWVLCL